jgi:2-(1,2-epoxy-1,2-dihydrophenyl)acetyl-CoA isomerase
MTLRELFACNPEHKIVPSAVERERDELVLRPWIESCELMTNPLLVSFDGPIARLTLNRPEAMNCFDDVLATLLEDAVDTCATRRELRALLLAANGRMFSAGGDLRFLSANGVEGGRRMITIFHRVILKLAELDLFTIVAARGAAGAGLSLVAGADFVVASDTARFTAAYTAGGLSPDGGLSFYLPRVVGARRARRMIVLNEPLDAAAAEAAGLVDQIVPEDELDNAAMTLARRIAHGPKSAFARVKRLLGGDLEILARQLDAERDAVLAQFVHAEGREGLAAFFERRLPAFENVGVIANK